ncbi:alpha/beta fold hydrolase [Halalkalibacterium ligniniphilum]|uniref:alpha/beta fold hydrolase n=1 Tax=Halalkalibacterium ligniniphilum TaxID=1134413 RepID=UPI00034B2B6B|nr:alpha/beta hydrolase [Halalkalibacterium ligniniphilum]
MFQRYQMYQTTFFLQDTDVYVEYWKRSDEPQQTFLLIHGFVSSLYSFHSLMPLLINSGNVLAIDLPGFGRSGKTKKFVYSFEHYATLILELLEKIEIDRVTIVGHSMGGQVALYVAKQSPLKVERLILLSSSAYLKRVKRPVVLATYFPFSLMAVKWWLKKQDIRHVLSQLVYNKRVLKEASLKEYRRPFSEDGFYKGLLLLIRHREGDLNPQELKGIRQPCLLLWGAEDKIIPLSVGKRLAKDLPNATLKVFSRTGHLLPEERPKEVAKAISSFLKET